MLGAGHWFDPTGPLLMGVLAVLAIISIIRRWPWPVSAGLTLLWIINFATIIFNPHIQGPVPQTPMKRKAIADAQRLIEINPARRDYQVALARAEFDYGELLRGHGLPKHSLSYYTASIARLNEDGKNAALASDEIGLHSAALFWGSLGSMQAKDANTAARWISEHLGRYESSTQAAELYVRSVLASGQPVENYLAQGDALSSGIWWRIAQQLRSLAMQRRKSGAANTQVWLNEQVERILAAAKNQEENESWLDRRESLQQWLLSEQSWEVYGPYDVTGSPEKAFASVHGPEQALVAAEPVDAAKKKLSVYPGLPVWLADDVAARDNVVALATSRLILAKAGSIRFRIGSDDAIKIWIDGELMLARNIERGLFPASDFVDVHDLAAGEHRLLIKIYNWKGEWGYAIDGGLTDGWPLPLWSDAEGRDSI